MKLQIKRDNTVNPLTLTTSVVERRQTLPILSNILLEVDSDGILRLIGTDLEVETQIEIPIDVDGLIPGKSTVSARKLLDICRALPEGSLLKITQKESKVNIQCGNSRFSLQSLPAEDFPRLDDAEHWEERVKLSQGSLRALLEKTSFSMAHQDVRYFLNGVLLELSETEIAAVATDGHRLARSAISLNEPITTPRQAIVPRKAVQELNRFLDNTDDPVTVEMNPSHLRFSRAGAVLTTKVIDGKFPDYRSVVEQNLTRVVLADRVELYDVLARTAVLTNEKYRGIRLEVESGGLKVTAHNPDQEEASDQIAIDYDGEKIEIGFNVAYLMDAIRAIHEEKVEILLEDTSSGCLLRGPGVENTQYLIMPMRL
ncbi:MAG: DNA polymerase III subunit beta [Gammaproteobacteria bacterium]|nr:DNA polymerase III subunit beta [Gammaproteobacteria bacterium]|tara:strand:+ start:22 stop:1134 length:1113 start_codon:yes stop_codon:yes gene_type:complete